MSRKTIPKPTKRHIGHPNGAVHAVHGELLFKSKVHDLAVAMKNDLAIHSNRRSSRKVIVL